MRSCKELAEIPITVKTVNAVKRFAHCTNTLESCNELTALTDICMSDNYFQLRITHIFFNSIKSNNFLTTLKITA